MLGADRYVLGAEKRPAQLDRSRKWLFAAIDCAADHADQTRPIDLRRALQLSWPRIAEPRNIRKHQDVTDVIQSAAPGAPEHLQQLVRLDVALEVPGLVTRVGNQHGTHRKIYSRRQTHRRDHDVELARFRQRLDQTRPDRIAQSAVMIS